MSAPNEPGSSSFELSGRRAVVTGASSGIGRAIATAFARAGAAVLVHARRSGDRLEKLRAELTAGGAEVKLALADLGNVDACHQLVATAYGALGGVDIWVNNAGADVLTGAASRLDYASKLQLLFEVDLRGTIVLTREVAKCMIQDGGDGGAIINMGWDQATTGMEGDNPQLFSAVKGAIMSFSRSAALSYAPKVRVNCLAPGWIRTAWGEEADSEWQERVERETPLGRWGTPEDVARVACFLASPAAAFMTGQVVRVNGGAV